MILERVTMIVSLRIRKRSNHAGRQKGKDPRKTVDRLLT